MFNELQLSLFNELDQYDVLFFTVHVYNPLLGCVDGLASSGESGFIMGLFFPLTNTPPRQISK